MKAMSDKELYEFAKKKVESKRGFVIHLSIYLIFSLISVIILFIDGFKSQYIIPMLGWGIGIIFHIISINVNFSSNFEEQIEKEFNKLRGN